ncbi:TadE/TadG family type IV pilus assembly protein [Rhodopseudomonas palustris]|uniref:TadE/TadG family type IV pilus assembly protein n=1 Tax=Rhodopseudomonas palustris TaxID=1076 RepID=UPI002ACD8078|nr:TadE/TadG family type IV pilus assembly protein [Rhodopseudomonas palustris]WQG98279.1 TadE/TadG family type IV pilus assembly protein [Rhodopseudomonas palustris]
MQKLLDTRHARRVLRRFGRDRSGNIAVIFAIALLPTLGFLGAAIDYAMANRIRAKLQSAQDAAVLLAVSHSSIKRTTEQAKADAVQFFNATLDAYGLSATIKLDVTESDGKRSASSEFTSTVKTQFLNLLGYPTLAIGNRSTSTASLPIYQDFYLLLDNSPSMGVAATNSDIATMVANTSDKCAFACHDLSNSNDYYKLAKKLGVKMRIDVVRQAVQQLTTTATLMSAVNNQFRMAVYTFGSSCASLGLTTVANLSSSMSSVQTSASAIDLMTIPKQNYNNDQCTDFDGTLAAMNTTIPSSGTGTAEQPQKWLFFVSDGVADAYYPSTCTRPTVSGGRCQEPLTVAQCKVMKDRGIQIAVLYTTYLALPTNDWYNQHIAPFNPGPYGPSTNSQIAAKMQACASPGFYFEVSPTQGISEAMDALFKKAVAKARLSS